ncbi:pyridine nucleotide-disulfide oxidoreductase-domain-containing protein, partial [Dimargaris cristalligena]
MLANLIAPARHIRRPLGQCRFLHVRGPKTVVLGSGWGGFQLMRDLDKNHHDVTVISPRNHFVFTPLLASTSVGTLEFRCILEPVRRKNNDIKFYEATCDAIDPVTQTLSCTSSIEGSPTQFTVPYDKLIIAVGAESNTFGIPGVKEHALFLKEVKDARKIRQRVLDCFEQASQPNVTEEEQRQILHFAVVGGGPTGIEFSSELSDFIRDDLRKLYPHLVDQVSMTVYDVAPTILSSFDHHLADYAVKRFQRRGIRIRTRTHITEVTERELLVDGKYRVPYGMLVWSTGITETPLVRSLGHHQVAKDPLSKRLLTDNYFRLLSADEKTPIPNVFSIGDCATIQGYNLPATAQVATQKGKYLGRVFNRVQRYDNWSLNDEKPFTYNHMGSMAYLGGWNAAATNGTGVATKAPGFKITDYISEGHMAWLFWRTSYFT